MTGNVVRYTFGDDPSFYYTGHPGDYVVGHEYDLVYEPHTGRVQHLCHIPERVTP